jgi:hypothetical protein
MSLEWKVNKNPNAYREISKEEYQDYFKKHNTFTLPTYYNDGKYFMMTLECYTLIWLCGIVIGIPKITEDNFEQVYKRINVHEKIFGASLYNYNPKTKMKSEYNFNLELVKKNIGISTNGTWVDTQEWKSMVIDRIVDDATKVL